MSLQANIQTITLGGGCFWCTEAVFVQVRGVLDVESGYCNGQTLNPSYEQICTGRTGHAEVVKLVFDSAQIGMNDILDVFFGTHDPTTLNRQGNDSGTQYRSAIFTHSAEQLRAVQAYVAALDAANFGAPVVTEVAPVANYSCAEPYHQDYFENHPEQGYCAFVVSPKVDKFRDSFRRFAKT